MNIQKKPNRTAAKPVRKSKYDEDFDPIDATPEEVAMAIVSTPPKRDWRYLDSPKGPSKCQEQ